MLTIILDSATLRTQLPAYQGKCLTTKLSTIHFAMVGLNNKNPWVVGRSISLNMNVERRNTWNEFLVSSVLVCLYAGGGQTCSMYEPHMVKPKLRAATLKSKSTNLFATYTSVTS